MAQRTQRDEDGGLRRRLRSLPTFARELIAGGVAGGLAKTAVAPLERTKIVLQTHAGADLTVAGVLHGIWRREGLAGLFRGNSASVLRIVPYAAIHFGSYESFRRALTSLAAPASAPGSPEHAAPLFDLLAGSASGATAVVLTYPLDLVRTRLAWEMDAPAPAPTARPWPAGSGGPAPAPVRRAGIWALLSTTAAQEGISGLYRGVTPTLLGILPYAGLKFYVFRTLKNHYRAWLDSRPGGSSGLAVQQQQQQQQPPLPIGTSLLFGGAAGLVAQTATYPLDVIRRQLQVAHLQQDGGPPLQQPATAGTGTSAAYASSSSSSSVMAAPQLRAAYAAAASQQPSARSRPTIASVTRRILAAGGPGALYKGLSINFMKVTPSTAIGFTVYDTLKAYLGLSSSL